MGFPINPAVEMELTQSHMRSVLKKALGKYMLGYLKDTYPTAYAKRAAEIVHKDTNTRREHIVKAHEKEDKANNAQSEDVKSQIRAEIDSLLLKNIDVRDWLYIMKDEWPQLQNRFPQNEWRIIYSHVNEILGICINQSHEHQHSLCRFADTCAYLLEAINAEEASHMRDIATRLSPGYSPPITSNGNGNSNSQNGKTYVVDEGKNSPPIPEEPDGSTERISPVSPDGDYFLLITSPNGESTQFSIPADKHRIIIGRGASSDISINDKRVSRAHAQVVYDTVTGFTITDLYSANGTILNKKRITHSMPIRWAEGEIVTICDTSLILRRGFVS